jgi:hypothetical protein
MQSKSFGRLVTVLVALGAIGSTVRADEIVHFTNGSEMTVRSHVVEGEMIKLDLGGNNTIAFPILMVGKIVNAGQNVFLNPVYYPSNQAIPAVVGTAVANNATPAIANPPPVGLARQGGPGRNGARLGEAADNVSPNDNYGSGAVTVRDNRGNDDFSTPSHSRFDPLRPMTRGGAATIDPPKGKTPDRRVAPQMSARATAAPSEPPAPVNGEGLQPGPSSGDSGDETANSDDPAQQDPPPDR